MTDWADEKIQEILANPDRIPLNVVPNGLLGRVAHALREVDAAAERRGMELASQWQPIGTAPKDREIEGANKFSMTVEIIRWGQGQWEWQELPTGKWIPCPWGPTHWRPLVGPLSQAMEPSK